MIEFEHSPLGGSGAKRWLNCGASFLLQRLLLVHGEFEQLPSSEFADLGTAAHELGAMCLAEEREPYEFVGTKIGKYTVHPSDLDPDAVAVYVNYCAKIIAEGGSVAEGVLTLIEQTIHLPEIHPLFKGTVDFGHFRPLGYANPGLWLVDYKNGEGIGVQAFQNEQLLYYAVLLIMKLREHMHDLPRDFPIYLGIVQPNYWGIFDEPEIWITDLGTVSDWGANVLMPAMQRLIDDKRDMLPEDEFVSGDHCQFCPVMLDCPKLRFAFETYASQDEFIEMLTDEELSDLYARKDDARRYGNALEQVVFARKVAGRPITSAKLVEKMTRRVWKPGAEQAAREKFGEQAYEPKKLKSPAQLEKLSSGAKAFALEYGFKPDADRLTVAPLSDRRAEAIASANEIVFKKFAIPIEDLGW